MALADIYLQYPLGEGDGIHPGDAGHAHMADAYILAIRGETPTPASKPTVAAADLKDNGDGTVTNTKAGLMMVAEPNALGEVASQADAVKLVESMNAEKKFGHDDWRLAKRSELFGLIDPTRRPAIVTGAPFKGIEGFYYIDTEGKGWGIDLTVGIAHTLGGRGSPKRGHVFPVRDAK